MVKKILYELGLLILASVGVGTFAVGGSGEWSMALFAFSEEGEGQRIWLVKGEEVKRYDLPEATAAASWSPDGKSLAYCPLSEPGRVKVKSGGGSGGTVLDRGLGARGGLWWSPKGEEIAFLDDGSAIPDPGTREKAGSPWAGGLSVVEVKRGRSRRIIHNPEAPGDPVASAAWSPDGKWLAALDEGGGLSVIKLDGTGRKFCERLATGFAWQGDSKSLVVTGASFLGWRGIGVWKVEEGRLEMVLEANEEMSSEEFNEPCLSAGGDRVAFSYEARRKETGERIRVSVRCLDLGIREVQVVAAGEGGAWAPRFLPDGQVGFLSSDDPAFAGIIAERAEVASSDGTRRKTVAMVPGELFYSLTVVP